MPRHSLILYAIVLTGAALPAAAVSAHVSERWPVVARAVDEQGGCALAVTGNGQAYRIAASGYEPASRARLVLANADMTPIDRPVRVDAAGLWTDYYLPFLWHRDGGQVTVTVASPRAA